LIKRLCPPGNVISYLDIVSRGKRWQQVELLKHKSDLRSAHLCTLGVVKGSKVDSADLDFARVGASKAAEQVKQRRLAAA
jgi:hypothetical protein